MLAPLLSTLLAFAADEPIPPPTGPMITFEVRHIDLQGVGWRNALAGGMEQVGWVDGVTTWTLPDAEVKTLLTTLQADTTANVVQAPNLTTWLGAKATVIDSKSQNLVTGFDRIADGPRFEATAIAFQPRVATIDEGVSLTLSADRAEGGGYQVTVDVREKFLAGIQQTQVNDGVKANPKNGMKATHLATTVQVPQVVQVAAAGTYPVAEGRHLLVSLGPRERDQKGRFVTRRTIWEKLLLITVHEYEDQREDLTARPLPELPSPLGN